MLTETEGQGQQKYPERRGVTRSSSVPQALLLRRKPLVYSTLLLVFCLQE
ncbi:unnamed protein product [Ectocarpus sp. 12 AP-2014]